MGKWIVYSKDGKTAKCEVRNLEYEGVFMGACTINATLSASEPVDFEIGDYLEYRGERFEMNYDPAVVKQASRGSVSDGFVYENVVFHSLSDELTRCDFLDVVLGDNGIHYTSLPTFSFFAERIEDLADRIQANLDRVYTGDRKWEVKVSPTYSGTANFNISVSNQTVWDALAFVNSKFGTNFVIRGRTITIGTSGVVIDKLFTYGKGNGLYKVERNAESEQKIITRLRAYGSTRNLPHDYYKRVEGGFLPNNMAVKHLMLPSFPTETHDPYVESDNVAELGVREGTIFFDGSGDLEEIYPTMEGMTAEDLEDAGIHVNATGALDVVADAEQIEDDGVAPEEGEIQGTFTITLKDIGFNINDYLSTSGAATLSMKDGMCGGRDFEITECKQEGSGYVLTCKRVLDESLDLYFPYKDYQIKSGDRYVLLNIEMPDVYIKAASQRLLAAAKAYLAKNDYVRYSYTLSVDNIFMARQHDKAVEEGGTSLHDTIKEGDIMRFRDDDLGVHDSIIIDNLSIKEDSDSSLIPEYSVTLRNDKVVGTIQKIQNQINNIVSGGYGGGSVDMSTIQGIVESLIGDMYLRKDKPDATPYTLGVGGIDFRGKQISRFIRYYDEDKPEEASDADFYSALATDMKIEESLENLDKRYLRKDKEDTAQKHIEFQEGITVHQLAEMENIDVKVLARIAKAFVTQIGSEKFVDGFFGEGYQIWKAIATGDWNFTIDRLTVRKVMTVYELIVQKIRSVGGMVVVSAGNGKVKEVEQVGLEYKFTFEDENTFEEHDLMRCQVWTGSGVKYYWVEVVRVEDGAVYTRVADFAGVEPSAGDEVVLMGNTQNPLRQGLVLISAAEDGQPRVDVLDGVKTTNFDDCLKARLGGLDGITDSRFPADMQPQGYGLYANNCYLTGVFVLSNGKDVQTQFAIMEGMIRANMSSIQQQINAEDNYLSNASMTTNLIGWEFNNDVKVFRTSGGLLHFNGNFYAIKNAIAGIVPNGEKTVLRLKNSFIRQKNASLAMHPTFDLVEQMTTDADGKEVGTGVMLYRPRMFYVSFRYMVTKRGTLRVYFENEQKRNDFEEYEPLNYTKVLEAGNSFAITDDFLSGKWNGTGDFYLSFDGDMYLYDLALSDDPLSDMEERWSMQLEITEKKIQANAEHIIQQGQNLEEYRSEFLYTAEQLRTEFTALVQNEKEDITEAYTGLVTQTAQSLESDYTAKIGNYYGKVTEEYNSKITQTAKDITTTLNAKIDATDKAIGDLEVGLKADYNAKISASAASLQSDYNSKITDLRTGDIANLQSSIEQQAGQIALKASQSNVDALTGRVTNAEARFDLYVLETELDNLVSKIEISADQVNLSGAITYQMFSPTLAEKFETKADGDDLYALEQELNNSVAALNRTISSLQTDVDGKASTTSLNNKVNELNTALNTKADSDLTNAVLGGSTLVVGGYINTDVIDVDKLVVKKLKAVKDGYTYTLDANGFVISDSDGDRLTELYVNNNFGYFMMKRNDKYFSMDGNSLMFASNLSENGVTSISAKGIELKSYSAISSFKIGNFHTNIDGTTDFIVMTRDLTLPGASASNKGKIIFVKFDGAHTLYGSIIKRHEKNVSSSSKHDYAMSAFYISNGTYWYEFLSNLN